MGVTHGRKGGGGVGYFTQNRKREVHRGPKIT